MKSILNMFSSPKVDQSALQSMALVPDRPSLIYHAGELVSGHIVLTVNSQVDISQVQISLKGRAAVSIPLDRAEQHRPENKINGMMITHFKKDNGIIDLVYNPATVYNQQLSNGRHNIGFSFMLPPTIPSSLPMTEFGGIEYTLHASIQGHPDKNTSMKMTVLSNPITTPESLSAPLSISNEKFVGLIGGKRLSMKCQLPTTGWTPGAVLPIQVSVENESKKFMALKCLLKQEITFTFDALHKKVVGNKIAFADGPQIEPRANVNHTVHLQIPLNLPIVQNTCPLIQIQYHVSIKLDIPGSFDLQCKLPIILTQTLPPTHGAPPPGVGVVPAPVMPGHQQPYPIQGYVPGTMTQPGFHAPVSSAPPPGINTMGTAPDPLPTYSAATAGSAPYPTLEYGMPQPAFNPHVPPAPGQEAMPMPSKTVQYPQLN